MRKISPATIGLVGLALGLGVGLFMFRDEIGGRSRGARRKFERAARRFELPSPRMSAFESDGALSKLIQRWRD